MFDGELIKILRGKHNLTQAELAHKVGVTQVQIGRLEGKNNCNPSFSLLEKIASVFNLSVGAMLSLKETPPKISENEKVRFRKNPILTDELKTYIEQTVKELLNK